MRRIATLLLAGSLAAQTVWTVNSAGGAQFTAIQPAITAAAPGDRIEVFGGAYGSFVVDKGVDIEAMTGALCTWFEVATVPNGQAARVAGFTIDKFQGGFVRVRDCPGAVLLADLGQAGFVWGGLYPGLAIVNSPNVFVRGGVFTGHGTYGGAFPGIRIDQSRAVLVGTTAVGGRELQTSGGMGMSGWPGLYVVNSHVTLVGVDASGGAATSGGIWGGTGGHGIQVASGMALVLGATTLRGAPGGSASPVPGSAGLAALGNVHFTPDTVLVGSTSAATPIASRPIVTAPPAVPIGSMLAVSVRGGANQPVWLGLDFQHDYAVLPALAGALNLTSTAVLVPSLLLDPSGAGSLLVPIPNQPALRNRSVFAQGAAFAGGTLVLTAPTVTRTK